MKILMVCLGNICRSPIAEGILQHKIKAQKLNWIVDSAGTSGWHDGEAPDSRAIKECQRNGIDISRQISRQLTSADFKNFDIILAMDHKNYSDIIAACPDQNYHHKVKLAMAYSDDPTAVVPDPYYDGRFSLVFEMLDKSFDNFVREASKISVAI